MKRVTFLTGLLICSLLLACGPSAPAATPTPEPTPTPVEIVADSVEDVAGIWAMYCSGAGYYAQFLADGTVRIAASVERFETFPVATGSFWFEGAVFHEIDTKCSSKEGTYEVWLVQEAGETVALRWKVIKDDCGTRAECYRGLTPRASGQ